MAYADEKKSDIEIAQATKLLPVYEIAESIGVPSDHLEPYGHYKAKIDGSFLENKPQHNGKLILVTAMTPTPGGRRQNNDDCRIGRRTARHRETLDCRAA